MIALVFLMTLLTRFLLPHSPSLHRHSNDFLYVYTCNKLLVSFNNVTGGNSLSHESTSIVFGCTYYTIM